MGNMEEKMTKAAFVYKPMNLQELKHPFEHRIPFVVECMAEVTPEQFHSMGESPSDYQRFLYDIREAMHYDTDKEQMKCLLVTTPDRTEGLLVVTEGYAYVRYAAYVPDCSRLELSGVPKMEQVDFSGELPQEYWSRTSVKEESVKTGEGR